VTIGVDKYALKNKILGNGSATKTLRHKDYNLILLIPFFNNRYVKNLKPGKKTIFYFLRECFV
jgi:hypothetical protein